MGIFYLNLNDIFPNVGQIIVFDKKLEIITGIEI